MSEIISSIFTLLLLLPLLLFLLRWLSKLIPRNAKRTLPPEAAGGWPLIGHLHLLRGAKLPHLALASMADRYGPVFTIRLGLHRYLVVSTPEIVKECFTTNDLAFSNRPPSTATEIMCYNYAMFGFSPYGSYWRDLRKIATLELLSNHRLSMFAHLRESELRSAMKELHELCLAGNRAPVEMKTWLEALNLNLIVKIIAGNIFEETKMGSPEVQRLGEANREFFNLMGVFTIGDAFPFLKGLDFGGYKKIMKMKAGVVDGILQEWLEDHKKKRTSSEAEKDFMDIMISVLEDAGNLAGAYDSDTINKSTCLGLLLGGSDTSSVTLTWALSLLLNNPHALKKAQDELDSHIGRERHVNEADVKNLLYIQAIIKETLRLSSPSRILPPRQCSEDCTVGGYHVPAGTRLFVNLWKLHRDPCVWPDPLEFRPERFLTTHRDIDFRGQHSEFVPFGSGRRACPGITFAIQVMQYTLASLLHGFDIESTTLGGHVDMTESPGFSNPKATPLEVILTPRLPSHLYG